MLCWVIRLGGVVNISLPPDKLAAAPFDCIIEVRLDVIASGKSNTAALRDSKGGSDLQDESKIFSDCVTIGLAKFLLR